MSKFVRDGCVDTEVTVLENTLHLGRYGFFGAVTYSTQRQASLGPLLLRRRYKYSMPALVPKGCTTLEAGSKSQALAHGIHDEPGRP